MMPPDLPEPRYRAVCPHLAAAPQEPAVRVILSARGGPGPLEVGLCRDCGDLVAGDISDMPSGEDDPGHELLRKLQLIWPSIFGGQSPSSSVQ